MNDETQVDAMSSKTMVAQFDPKTWRLKSLTFDNRSLHGFHGEDIQNIENLRGKIQPFSNSIFSAKECCCHVKTRVFKV